LAIINRQNALKKTNEKPRTRKWKRHVAGLAKKKKRNVVATGYMGGPKGTNEGKKWGMGRSEKKK